MLDILYATALAAWIAEKDYVALFAIFIIDFPVKKGGGPPLSAMISDKSPNVGVK
jgi:hypothetical protein